MVVFWHGLCLYVDWAQIDTNKWHTILAFRSQASGMTFYKFQVNDYVSYVLNIFEG